MASNLRSSGQSGWRKPLAFGLAIALVIFVVLSWTKDPRRSFASSDYVQDDKKRNDMTIDADKFLDRTRFDRAMTVALSEAKVRTEPCDNIRGGIVNHHVLASDLLADFFAELGRCRPDADRVIILSPDHFHQGQVPIVTHAVVYRTNQDVIASDPDAIQRLVKRIPSARDDEKPFGNEHGVGALVPFLHKTLPKASIIPVLIEGRATNASVKGLADWLAEEMKDPLTLVVVSSDMSHYLTEAQAKKNDVATTDAFKKNDADFFWQANDDFTDNGKSIWTVLAALRNDSLNFRLFKTAISTEYGGSTGYATSYITGFWEEKAACPAGVCVWHR